PCQIGRKRESVVSGSDDDTIELFHSLLPTTASTLLHEPTLDHGVDAFVAVDELRHAQVAGHSDYYRKHLVLAAFDGGEGVRLEFEIRTIRQDDKKFSPAYPQNYPRATLEFRRLRRTKLAPSTNSNIAPGDCVTARAVGTRCCEIRGTPTSAPH